MRVLLMKRLFRAFHTSNEFSEIGFYLFLIKALAEGDVKDETYRIIRIRY
jgi:hypothetical protein